ncbi:MAG: hypothetical protein NPINA01_00100 [Nitrospinaceae bacterium]|nr:MAG: hypothetical protein NPINA01_00100 [Nitrospinaceae bacterium]
MALGLALTGLAKKKEGEKLWTLDTVSWWDELELIKDPRFEKLDLGPDKMVYEAVLAVKAILELHEKYGKKFLEVFDKDPMTKPYYIKRKKMVEDLGNKLNDPELHLVRAWVFDWDY